jgi:hypothetical protein
MTTLVFAASYGIAFGRIQQLPQIIGAQAVGTPAERGQKEIIAKAKDAVAKASAAAAAAGEAPLTPAQKRQIAGNASDEAVAKVSSSQEFGGLVGGFSLRCSRCISLAGAICCASSRFPRYFSCRSSFFGSQQPRN